MAAAVLVWLGFSRTEDRVYRLISLVTGAMLASPYGRKYDLAALQPAIVLLLLHPRRNLITMIAAAFGFILLRGPWGIIGLAAMALGDRTPGLQFQPRASVATTAQPAPSETGSLQRPS